MLVCSDYRQFVLLRSFVEEVKKYVYNHNQTNHGRMYALIADRFYCCNNLSRQEKVCLLSQQSNKPWMHCLFLHCLFSVCLFWLQTECIVAIICWSSEKVCLWSQQSNKQWMFVCCDNLQIWSSFYTFKIVGLQNGSLLSMCSVFLYKHISYSRFSAFTGIQRPTDIPRTVVRREAQIWRLQR